MKSIKLSFTIVVLLTLACSSKKPATLSAEQIIIKSFYKIPEDIFHLKTFRLDTLHSIMQIAEFSDSICRTNPDKQNILAAFIYNLADSSFTPSVDTSVNIAIPCGIGNPAHGKIRYGNDYFITRITNDSLTIHPYDTTASNRISINELKQYTEGFLKRLDKPLSSLDVRIVIDISNNPSKELFERVFKTLFTTYYSFCFDVLKSNRSISLEEIAKKSVVDPYPPYDYMNRITILLTRDSTGNESRFPILTSSIRGNK